MRALALLTLAVCASGCDSVLGLDEITADGPPARCLDDPLGGLSPICVPSSKFLDRRTLSDVDTGTADSVGDCDLVQAQGNGGPEVCVIAAHVLTVGTMVARGTRPLVLVGDTIDIDGMASVASIRAQQVGAGAEPADCSNAPLTGMSSTVGGSGGGAGGTLRGLGGRGGAGMPGPISGGVPLAPGPLFYLRGGCDGGDAGATLTADTAGLRGAGGGAVYLMARAAITVGAGAVVNASGSGGGGGVANMTNGGGGGGGGGSGGMIVFVAPSIVLGLGARIAANGGGGGGGGGFSKNGTDGADPDVTGDTAPPYLAAGGIRTGTAGGFGGAGAAGDTPAVDGTDGNGNGGGGGGGGSVGIVLFYGEVVDRGAILTPSPGL